MMNEINRVKGRGIKKGHVFVPRKYLAELQTMSKAALMDLAWDLAASSGECAEDDRETIGTLRERARLVLEYRGDRCQLL